MKHMLNCLRSFFGLLCLGALALLCAGCASTSSNSERSLTKIFAFQDKKDEVPKQLPAVSWRPALPKTQTRADLVTLQFPATNVAYLLPEIQDSPYRLVSTLGGAAEHLELTHINSREVTTLADALQVSEEAHPSAVHQVDFALPGSGDATVASRLNTLGLQQLLHQACGNLGTLKLEENGSTWALSSHGPVRCRISPRIDRQRGLVHLIVGLKNCGDSSLTVPGDIQVRVGGQIPLRCLTTSQTLARLYPLKDDVNSRDLGACADKLASFAEVAELGDYLMATNYETLAAVYDDAELLPTLLGPCPEPYPGGAVLADARALGAFLMQRKVLPPKSPEQIGWVMFAGELGAAEQIQVILDLGAGPQVVEFELPRG